MSPWLLQESFNTVCAATNTVVEECVTLTSNYPHEQERMMTGVLDLLLYLLTTPQSSVTHLRAVGGALQALEQFGIDLFLDIAGTNLQHWIRVILSLMNSTSLSVRSIAVDFVVSLLGSIFELHGDIEFVSIIFATVLPEVTAREIALYSVSGRVSNASDMARSIWPLRRSFADLEDANPLDDGRVDPQLVPVLAVLCRACQAVMDGVLIEMRLRGESALVVGAKVNSLSGIDTTFDADEESLFEAATFFAPEMAPMQRIRWLMTLRSLHESKEQWVEAAETLFLCARTISDSMPQLSNVWRPSRFVLWSDARRSLWLDTVGEDVGHPDRGNTQVMDFANEFLEPSDLLGTPANGRNMSGKLQQPTVSIMSDILGKVTKAFVRLYLREERMDELAHLRLEALLKTIMDVLDSHSFGSLSYGGGIPSAVATARKRHIEDEAALRRVLASVSGEMTQLAERLLVLAESDEASAPGLGSSPRCLSRDPKKRLFNTRPQYVAVQLSGKQPSRFKESTALPTFLPFDTPCVCRLPESLSHMNVEGEASSLPTKLCLMFAQPLLKFLQQESTGVGSIVLQTEPPRNRVHDSSRTFLYVFPVEKTVSTESTGRIGSTILFKSVFYRKDTSTPPGQEGALTTLDAGDVEQVTLVEMKVAHPFPCALSRQRSLITTEVVSSTPLKQAHFFI